MFHRLSGVAGIAALLAGHAAAQEAPSLPGDIQVFEPSFFARYNPTTAQDMVNQVPGFSIQEGDAVRGFGGSAGNILINGNRPSTKNSLTALLGRDLVHAVDGHAHHGRPVGRHDGAVVGGAAGRVADDGGRRRRRGSRSAST